MTASDTMIEVDRLLAEPLAIWHGSGDGVAFVGPDVPIEVLLASGRPFGHLSWRAEDQTPWADQWLESSFPFWARSILEQWHQGRFDEIDTVVFSRADDASQRLYYYVAELKRRGKLEGPSVRMFDIALIPRDTSLAHTETAVSELMHALDVSPRMLVDGIDSANRLRRTHAGLERERDAHGAWYERVARAALWSDPTQWIDALPVPAGASGRGRVLLAGSVPVDDRIHMAAESAGASIVAEAHAFAPSRLGPELELGNEPLERALALHLRAASIAPRSFFDRAAWIVREAERARATAVIVWLTREDEGLAWTLPAQQRALAAARLPALLLPAARWQVDDGALERIAEFCRETVRATA
jgi:hypothetical protein